MRDVFGNGLMACYLGETQPSLLKRDDGLVEEYRFEPYFSDYDAWSDRERKALEYVKGRVLDLGCGAGRHSLWLQDKGFEVVSIDVSLLACRVSHLRGAKNCLAMSALKLGFKSDAFDTVLLLGNNFGITGNIEGTKTMLNVLHNITSESACVITDSLDPVKTDNPQHLKYYEFNKKRGRPIGQITLRMEHSGEEGDWFDLLFVNPNDMAEICRGCGWFVERIFGEKNGAYAAVLTKNKHVR